MTVFRACMKILRQNIGLFLLYIGIFFFMMMMTVKDNGGAKVDSFELESLKIGFIDEDESELSKGLEDYLAMNNQISEMKNNEAEIQNRLFNRDVEYIVKVPENFQKEFEEGNVKLPITKVPESTSGFYIDQTINNFLNEMKVYHAAGYSMKEAAEAIQNLPGEEKVTLLGENKEAGNRVIGGFFQFAPFTVLNVICFGLCSVYAAFSREDVKKRTIASAFSANRRNGELLFASFFVGMAVFVLVLVFGLILLREVLFEHAMTGYYIANLFCCILSSLALAYLLSLFGKSQEARSGIINSVTLGMSFLCGVFVPLSMIHKNVRTLAKFLPMYWYERVVELLKGAERLSEGLRFEILQAMMIQILFAVAMIVVALVSSNQRLKNGKV